MKWTTFGMAFGLVLGATLSTASAQQYPTRPMKIVVPYTAGGATDILARYVAEKLGKRIGQPVVVENKVGANGLIGAKFVADSAPDGNTLVIVTPGWPATKIFVKSPPLPVPDGLEPVALLTEGRFVLASSTAAPFKTFKEFVAFGQANPGKLNYATAGVGDSLLLIETIRAQSKIDMVKVPYPGAVRSMTALMADEVQLAIAPENLARMHTTAGKMRILAISGPSRSAALPDVPTFAESGFPTGRNNWFALLAARGTPPDVIKRLNADIVAVMSDADASRKAGELAMEVATSTAEELRQRIERSINEYQAMADLAGVKPE